MKLRKVISAVILMTMFFSIFAYDVEFSDGVKAQCEVVGKKGNAIYLSNENLIYKVEKNDINSIKLDGQEFKQMILSKADFIQKTIDTNNAIIYKPQEKIEVAKPEKIMKYNDMSEREFQMYLMQQNAIALDNHAKALNRTTWTIWGISMGIICTLFVISASK